MDQWRRRRPSFMVGEKEEMPPEKCEECMSRRSHSSSLYLPECLVFNVLLSLPAKSVGRFRCVSKLWLSVSTDPYFILTHTRRTPKPLLVCPSLPPNLLHRNELFNTASFGYDKQGTDVSMSSCDGLVNFIGGFKSRGPCANNYVLNPLTGLRIDLPSSSVDRYGKYSSMQKLYYHRWTGQYRILNVNGKHAEVLNLGGTTTMNDNSWRLINSEHPGHLWVLRKKCVLVINDCLYWICETYSNGDRITVFDILEEAFSCMDLPHDAVIGGEDEEYGLVDIDGKLGCWMASNNAIDTYHINIWVKVEGGDKWRSAYSLHFCDWGSRRLINPFSPYALIRFAFFSRGEIVFLVNGSIGMLYLLRWDLNSGNHSTQLLSLRPIGNSDRILIHKETLVDMATITQNV